VAEDKSKDKNLQGLHVKLLWLFRIPKNLGLSWSPNLQRVELTILTQPAKTTRTRHEKIGNGFGLIRFGLKKKV
jgi:hypothetical protein